MPELVLTRSLTFTHNGRVFRRGEPQDVKDPSDYILLLQMGFKDPNFDLSFMHPSRLRSAPQGSEILVVRIGGLGDALMASIPLRDLAGMYPHLRISYATFPTYAPLFRDCTFLHRVLPMHELRGNYQWAIDLRGYSERDGREKQDRIQVFARYLLGRDPESYDYALRVRPEEVARGRMLAGMDLDPRPTIVLALEANMQQRMWTPWQSEDFVVMAAQAGWRTVLVAGQPHPTMLRAAATGVMNLSGKLRVTDLMCVVAAAHVVVAPDTGVAHLAEATKTRTVAYYTTVPPEARAAHYRYTRTLYAGIPCQPCYHLAPCGVGLGTACSAAVSPGRVLAEVDWIARHEPPYDYRAPFAGALAEAPRTYAPVHFGSHAGAGLAGAGV